MSFIDLVFPKTCLECGKSGIYICRECLEKVKKSQQTCPYCRRLSIDGATHAKCVRKTGLDGCFTIWQYEGVVRKAITALKYKYATEIVDLLSAYVVNEVKQNFVLGKLSFTPSLIPVPLFWYRKNFRGFNQSEEIGKMIAKDLHWLFETDVLIRQRSTTPQVQLKPKERINNLKKAFVIDTKKSSAIENKNVLLFDDVFTTGSTLKEAAKVLKKAGTKNVWGLTIAG